MGFLDEKYINLVIEAVNKAREGAEDYKEQYVHKQQEYSKITKKMRNKFDLPDTEEVKKSKRPASFLTRVLMTLLQNKSAPWDSLQAPYTCSRVTCASRQRWVEIR